MSFATTMTALKDKVDGLIANRVAKFAYTQQAYNSDDVNGVTEYNYSAEQNVPTSSASVLKVNETVLTKGWRTQASAITRMLMNHFLGRTSYNLNKTVDFMKAFMLAVENNMGVADGFAQLDSNGILPVSQGGTGKNTNTENAVLTGNGTDAVNNVPTFSGALFATSVGGAPSFGTLPVAQGGTGKTTFTSGSVLVGNGINAIAEKAIDDAPTKDSNNLVSSAGVYASSFLSTIKTQTVLITVYTGSSATGTTNWYSTVSYSTHRMEEYETYVRYGLCLYDVYFLIADVADSTRTLDIERVISEISNKLAEIIEDPSGKPIHFFPLSNVGLGTVCDFRLHLYSRNTLTFKVRSTSTANSSFKYVTCRKTDSTSYLLNTTTTTTSPNLIIEFNKPYIFEINYWSLTRSYFNVD